MLDLIVLIPLFYLGYRNSLIAKRKGKNGLAWILLTVLACYLTATFGISILLSFFYKGDVNVLINLSKTNQQAFVNQIAPFFLEPIRFIFILLCGFGGYLLIRYILERKPDINKRKNNGIEEQ
ncbi:MAG TPA: hypothetical protein VN721_03430 [Flavipsychrobacter sp.]|nr:hypothetical protein [Flavipsychrobacter sp.]